MSPHNVCCGGFFIAILPQNADISAVFLYWNIYLEGRKISYRLLKVHLHYIPKVSNMLWRHTGFERNFIEKEVTMKHRKFSTKRKEKNMSLHTDPVPVQGMSLFFMVWLPWEKHGANGLMSRRKSIMRIQIHSFSLLVLATPSAVGPVSPQEKMVASLLHIRVLRRWYGLKGMVNGRFWWDTSRPWKNRGKFC